VLVLYTVSNLFNFLSCFSLCFLYGEANKIKYDKEKIDDDHFSLHSAFKDKAIKRQTLIFEPTIQMAFDTWDIFFGSVTEVVST